MSQVELSSIPKTDHSQTSASFNTAVPDRGLTMTPTYLNSTVQVYTVNHSD